MKKQILDTFIKKYSLNGAIDSVKWKTDVKNKVLSTNAITDEKDVLIDVKNNNFDAIIEDVEIGIYETSKLVRMLGVLADDVSVNLIKKDDKITSMTVSDKATEIQFVTADLSVIPVAPNLKKTPDFNVEIELTDELISKFIKSKNALQEVDTFTILMNKKKKLEMVLGYSNLNSNRITLEVTTVGEKNAVAKNISFNAKYFKEILSVNGDCSGAILKVSDAGLAMVQFQNDNFVSSYYMVESKRVD